MDFNSIKNTWRIQVLKRFDNSFVVRHRKKERTRSNLYDDFELEWQADFVFDPLVTDLNSMFPKIISILFSDDKVYYPPPSPFFCLFYPLLLLLLLSLLLLLLLLFLLLLLLLLFLLYCLEVRYISYNY